MEGYPNSLEVKKLNIDPTARKQVQHAVEPWESSVVDHQLQKTLQEGQAKRRPTTISSFSFWLLYLHFAPELRDTS